MESINYSPEYLAEYHGKPLLDVAITFIALETFFILLLLYSRSISNEKSTKFGMPALMTIGYFVCVGKIANSILMVKVGGAGHHLAALDPHTLQTMMKLALINQIVCPLATSVTRLAVCCLFYRIFGKASHMYRLVVKGTFLFILAILLVQMLIPFGNCKPFAYNWNKRIHGSCAIDSLALWRYLSLPNVITDIMMITIPIPALWKLRFPFPTRLGMGVCFVMAVLAMIAATLRVVAFLQVKDFNDITYDIIVPQSWTVAESGTYLIAGIFPTLHPLFKKLFGDADLDGIISRTLGRGSKNRTGGSMNSGGFGFVRMDAKGEMQPQLLGHESEKKKGFRKHIEELDLETENRGSEENGKRNEKEMLREV